MHDTRAEIFVRRRSNLLHVGRDDAGRNREQAMDKKAMRDETDRLIREALERGKVTVKQGKTRIEAKCGKCGAPNRVMADPGETRAEFTCKECGTRQQTL
jgi:hypothetical protein